VRRAPSLVRFAIWKYGQDAEIRNSVGKFIAVRQTGFGQGDSLAGILYDLSSFDQVEELSTALKEEEYRYNSDTYNVNTREPGFVVTYHDDTYVAGHSQVLNIFAERHPVAIYEKDGSVLNIPKSAITGREIDNWGGPPEGWKINYEGTKALGVYIGEDGWTKRHRDAKLESLKLPTESLQKLKPSSQLYLLSLVISARAQYTVGTVPTVASVVPTANSFNDSV
jgi:hypothetical protein